MLWKKIPIFFFKNVIYFFKILDSFRKLFLKITTALTNPKKINKFKIKSSINDEL